MSKFIGIEDLAANALIEMIEKNNTRKVSFEQLRKYGTVIIRWFLEKDEEAILLISRHYTNEMIRNYSDFFEINDEDETSYIELKDEKSVDDLRNHLRAYLSLEMLIAFTDKNNLIELGIRV
jgi:hypothetical protein